MAESVVSLTLTTLRDLLLEETKFLYGVSSQVKGLESLLKEIRCLLKDAERRQHESNSVRNWIAEIRDLAYRAEDAVETYGVEVSSRRGKGFRKLIKRFSCVLNESITLHQIGSEILEIRSEIERVYKNMQAYGIKEIIQGESSVSGSNENQQWKRQTYPFGIEDCFVGMEDDLNQLVSLIVDDKHRVISILGMGGIGKTTIARQVYSHFKTKRAFQSFAWICITQQCQIRSVLEDVLKQLNDDPQKKVEVMTMSDNELVRQLYEVQKAKRCLIVLDDLWIIDHWNDLKEVFLVAEINNKILLTTRKGKIAEGFDYRLRLLNVDDGWKLLKKKAVPEFAVEEELLQRIGKEMVRKCGCLPLGISLLGGILSKKKSLMEWELVNKNIKACLYNSEGIEQDHEISRVVDLSYEDLPSYLKPCFLCMGQYREDQIIYVQSLCNLWIAEGMISHENQGREETLMDVAELYLRELVSRCIVQVVYLSGDQYIWSCKLHDIVRELCLSKGKSEDFRLKVMNYQGGKLNVLDPSFLGIKTRYLTIHLTGIKLEDGFTSFHDEINNHNIRSLQFLKIDQRKFKFSPNVVDFGKLKLLRVLLFECCIFEGRKLPTEIGNLIYLRQLTLRRCVLDELPFSIRNLTNLYTLDLHRTMDVRIPNVLNKMLRLKHLYFPGYGKDNIGNYRLSLEGLEELEILVGFNSLVHDLKSVSKMKNLHTLHASIHDNKTLSEIINYINTNWNNLRQSRLDINEGCELTSTKEGLSVLKKVFACSSLHFLSILVPIRKLPAYDQCGTQIIFPTLVFLTLSLCEIEDDPMEILEKLPFLEYLHLYKRSYVGEVMICHAMGFPRLKILELKRLSNLIEWRVEQGAMPSLEELKINSCQHLEMIPDGLKFITTLQELQIIEMPELKKRVSATLDDGREGEDYHKVRHVPSILVW